MTTAAKECDILLADIQYCYVISSHWFSIVFVYGNHNLHLKEWLDTPAIYCKLILCHSFTTSYSTDGSKICIYKMSYGRRVQKSHGCPKTIGRTYEDFPSCPITRHDYQSPVQRPQEVLRQLRTTWDVLQDMTTKVPGPKNQTCPGTTRDIPGCYIHDCQSPRSKEPNMSWNNSGHPRMLYT